MQMKNMIKLQNKMPLFLLIFAAAILQGCSNSEQSHITQWPSPTTCDLHSESCTATMGDAQVTLKISPHPIPIARPLGIEVELENLNVQSIELDISGINMYMGYNRVTLTPANDNRYIGTSMLAFCTSQKMLWQITLMIHQKDGTQIQIPYTLETINRR